MKKLSTLLISSTFLLFTAVSCSNDNNDANNGNGDTPTISVTGVTLNQSDARLLVGDTLTLTASVLPADAENRTVIWSNTNTEITSVPNGTVIAQLAGRDTIIVTTQDGNHTATTTLSVVACNRNTPGWGESLGVVSFYTNETWTIEGNGISQIWSDAVTAVNCQKTTFSGGSSGNFNADCRSNPDFPGDFFSWCAVVRFADQLCPYPWRVPTNEDFRDLDIAMGGSGDNRGDTPQFVQDNYITRWGGRFGGFCSSVGTLWAQGNWSYYWSRTETDATHARLLHFGTNGFIFPQDWSYKLSGFSLRCIR